MPWEAKTVEEKRREFVEKADERKVSFSALCEEYGISRKTGYKWVDRHAEGIELKDKSRRPTRTPGKTPGETEEKILALRRDHPAWGPKKLKCVLEREGLAMPAKSTIAGILKRNDCITVEESLKHVAYKCFERDQPNELWQTDFKGDFLMANSQRCYPLTVLDDCTRYSVCVDAKGDQRRDGVEASFQRLFRAYGMPEAVLCDNGPPWGNSRRAGYTEFEVWLMKLAVLPIHGRPLHPQTQGKDERFHRTLKAEALAGCMLGDLKEAQKVFDEFREQYNHIRPHEALDMAVPASRYRPSARYYPEKPRKPEYPEHAELRRVSKIGYLLHGGQRMYLSEALIGETVAIVRSEEAERMNILFYDFRIGEIDLREKAIVNLRPRIYMR